ncbi:MAG: NHL repeat-containing protein [Planctomycetota bacterium]
MMRRIVALAVAAGIVAGLSGCKPAPQKGLIRPELFLSFGEECNIPDGMALDKDNNIILSVPNYIHEAYAGEMSVPKVVEKSYAGKLMKITFEGGKPKATLWSMLPEHPESGLVHPMGLEFGPDGNLYIADNQYFKNKDYKSRLLKVIVKDGKAAGCEVAVDGFKLANAVRWKDNDVYVSDTFFDVPDKDLSGIFKISMAEMDAGKVTLKHSDDPAVGITKEPHLIALITAKDSGKDQTAGADGVCFDSKGNLYTGNFGDGWMTKVSFKADGSVAKQEYIDKTSIECCDGIYCDQTTDEIYITNSKNNSIHILDTKTNKMRLLWVNEDDDGAGGLLDQPCEPLLRGNQLIVVNFDLSFPGLKNQTNDKFNTLSVFNLK